jgi:hypothetical protein
MATQNIAIPTGDSASLLATIATQCFENWNKEMGDAIINKNFVLAYLRSKAERVEVGGLDFAEPVLYSSNTNFGFDSKFAQIPSNYQTPTQAFRFDPVVLRGVVVINKVHELQNQGAAQIANFLDTLKKQATSTVENLVNAAQWNSAPTANVEPESLRTIVSATPTTGSIGGVDRAANVWARNKINSTTISSIGSAAGVAALMTFRAQLGGNAKTTPDFAVTTATLWGNLSGYLANLRRLTSNENMAKLGIDTFSLVPGCEIGYDGDAGLATDGTSAGCPANQLYFLNSKHLFYKVLKGGNMKFEGFSKKDNSLNDTSIFYHVYNMTTNLPSSMGLFTAITG